MGIYDEDEIRLHHRRHIMSELTVRMVQLEPARVAAAHGFGASPEDEAWRKILAWARAQGIDESVHLGRYFGFNNPSPSPASPNYGYEQWLILKPGETPAASDDITLKTFEGGLYAVTRCTLPQIGEAWRQLGVWRETSAYRAAHHQWLEEAVSPLGTPFDDMVLDIYLPVAG
jgi:DNA gyrase inhibitor GyrI